MNRYIVGTTDANPKHRVRMSFDTAPASMAVIQSGSGATAHILTVRAIPQGKRIKVEVRDARGHILYKTTVDALGETVDINGDAS